MEREIDNYINYLVDVKKSSQNTVQSYRRDLVKMMDYMNENGVNEVKDVNTTFTSFLCSLYGGSEEELRNCVQKYCKYQVIFYLST